MLTFTVAVNEEFVGKMPVNSPDWGKFNGAFTNTTIQLWPFVNKIRAGHAFTQCHKGYRRSDLFLSGQILALDMDTEDERSTIDYLSRHPFIAQFASLIYTTPSHTPDNPRARIVFVLSSAVHSPFAFTNLAEGLLYKFGDLEPDKVCKDPLRIFFGSKNCEFKIFPQNTLPLGYATMQIAKPYAEYKKKQYEQRTRNTVEVKLSDDQAEAIIQKILQEVSSAPDGQKHATLNRASFTLGGYVAAGLVSFSEAEQKLYGAIAQVPTVKSLAHAHRTIVQGLKDGSRQPIQPRINKIRAINDSPNPLRVLGLVH